MVHNPASKKILVIEDNRVLANLLELHLRDLTYGVELAFDGTRGLSKAQEGLFDLIILLTSCSRAQTAWRYAGV